MCGATFKITHQNPDYLDDIQRAFGIKDSEGSGYREIFFAKEANTNRIYMGLKGNKHTLIAQLDDVAKKTLLAYLTAMEKS